MCTIWWGCGTSETGSRPTGRSCPRRPPEGWSQTPARGARQTPAVTFASDANLTPDARGGRASAHRRVVLVHLVVVERQDAHPPLVLQTSRLEEPAPGGHGGSPAQQRAALPLRHASPHAELDAVVQRVGQALGA